MIKVLETPHCPELPNLPCFQDIYIDSFISLSTPWAGSSDALIALTAGFNFGIPVIEGIRVRREQRGFETSKSCRNLIYIKISSLNCDVFLDIDNVFKIIENQTPLAYTFISVTLHK